MTVSSTTGTTSQSVYQSLTAAAAKTTSATDDQQSRFLTLLTTQLKNQDPTNPADSAQMTSQLAQISTVTGINKLNDTMSSLGATLGSNQYLQAAGLVGHTVLATGNKLSLAGTGAGGVKFASPADHVTVTISDASGHAVRTIDMGAQTAGVHTFTWDGRTDAGAVAADGQYSFSVQAAQGGTAVTADTLMSGRVNGVVLGANGSTQIQLGMLGLIDMPQVVEIN